MKRIDLRDLIQAGQIQEEPDIGWDQVERLMRRAFQDLISAEKITGFDEPGAMDFVYKGMFHAAVGNNLISPKMNNGPAQPFDCRFTPPSRKIFDSLRE